ncbi:diguanylate cyclase domain-containing protein [Shewanella amazonensis]|uniref:Diguanylate cyclase/phosphodiesterase with GAF sensor n=1 Tax=Shewanella amazonensis (strain ATCC BAA-1098 / SB2B) TaxID=326297 RepID=A1SAR1_SHEAM|nr:diguanylate cyclase [Shewanella amazonensis]ABM01468.1 diguanylate cyclase/phosphodiesterase with GAF sensor [Shewanella amazonensis SB2B]
MFRDTGFKDEANSPSGGSIERLLKRVDRLRRLAGKYKRAEIIRDALLQITHIATEVNSPEDFYAGVHLHLKSLIAADNFFIATYNHRTERLEIPFFADEMDPHPAQMYPDRDIHSILMRGITGYVFRCGETMLCNEADFERLVAEEAIENLGSASHQWLGVPIRYQERTTGVLVVQTYDPNVNYGLTEIELMEFISHHISGVMERLRHQEQLEQSIDQRTKELSEAYDKLKLEVYERRRAERLQKSLFEIAELSASGLEQEDFYSRLHNILSHLIPASNCYIALLDDTNQQLHFPFYVSQLGTEPPSRRPLTDGLTEYLLSRRRPLLLDQKDIQDLVKKGEIYVNTPNLNNTQKMHQWIGVPLFIGDEVRGALTIYSLSMTQNYQIRDLELLTFVSQHIGTAIERKQHAEFMKKSYERLESKVAERTRELELEIQRRREVEQKLIHDAKHDALTGLPNRSMFTERLGQAVRHVRRHGRDQFALLFIDLDRFKQINDTLGHLEGDRFLIETARRLSHCIRENDTLGRLGGDEFVVLLDQINTPKDAEEVAERILSQLSEPFQLGDALFQSGASIGIAISGRSQQDTPESMLRDADAAMYQAKSRGKGCYVVYDSKRREEHQAELHDEALLRDALARDELYLKILPVESLSTGEPLAYRLSLGWRPSKGGELAEDTILSIAERSNLILELDRCLLRHLKRPLPLELNDAELHLCLSSAHLKHKHALRGLKNMVRELNLDPAKLWLFFDERALVQDTQGHIAGFEALGKLGVSFGLSGYGNGYSSLKSLTLMPIKALRLAPTTDRLGSEKVRLLTASAMAASSLGLTVIASGTECSLTRQSLVQAGIDHIQQLQPLHQAQSSVCA